MAQVNFNDLNYTRKENSNEPTISYFSLKDDNDFAYVRFLHDDVQSLEKSMYTFHLVNYNSKNRKINCIRTGVEPLDRCPLCNSGAKIEKKIFIKLLRYDRDPATGAIVVTPCIWERPAKQYGELLRDKLQKYGPLSRRIFTVTRHGVYKSKETSYTLDLADPETCNYNEFAYKPELFDSYDIIGRVIWDKSAADMQEFITTGKFPYNKPVQTTQQSTQTAQPQQNQFQIPNTQIPSQPYFGTGTQPVGDPFTNPNIYR